ncbi:hypothetical protein [Bacillus thuringiensis]|uniref:hypothetical protein n=1 Tax=Bacillus thuringiensis TaxID=1428 RepID=UPI000BFB224A|nr:hypothetical protein [Bacillus thuringiensis]PGT57934.1 hypothetical protein COD16_22390 [Bacillus thuringiensis]
MSIETGELNLNELSHISIMGIDFGYKYDINNESNNKKLIIHPLPLETVRFNKGLELFSHETLALLRSKAHFGIKHRTQLFEGLIRAEIKSINELLTLQALYSDMIVRLGTVLEDFAGMCFSCEKYIDKKVDIAQSFLSYSNPRNFYISINSPKKRRAKIKKIFLLPRSEEKLKRMFSEISEEESKLLWKAVEKTTDYIAEIFENIGSTIIAEQKDNVTLYDMYNKLKHGFSPIYPYISPMPLVISKVSGNERIEEIICELFFEDFTIMHNKLNGNPSEQEQSILESESMETVTLTSERVGIEQANKMKEVISDISFIYSYLIKKYLLLAEGSRPLEFILSGSHFSEEERKIIQSLLDNKKK